MPAVDASLGVLRRGQHLLEEGLGHGLLRRRGLAGDGHVAGRVAGQVGRVPAAARDRGERGQPEVSAGHEGLVQAEHRRDIPVAHQLHGRLAAVHQRVRAAAAELQRVVAALERARLGQLLDVGERLDDRRVGPGARLAKHDVLGHAGAADPVGQVLQVHQAGPLVAVGQRDRRVTVTLQRGDRREQARERGGEGQAELAEDGLVVEEVDRLGALNRHAVELPAERHRAQRGGQEVRGPAGVAASRTAKGISIRLEKFRSGVIVSVPI
jgi:hypothetical protein